MDGCVGLLEVLSQSGDISKRRNVALMYVNMSGMSYISVDSGADIVIGFTVDGFYDIFLYLVASLLITYHKMDRCLASGERLCGYSAEARSGACDNYMAVAQRDVQSVWIERLGVFPKAACTEGCVAQREKLSNSKGVLDHCVDDVVVERWSDVGMALRDGKNWVVVENSPSRY